MTAVIFTCGLYGWASRDDMNGLCLLGFTLLLKEVSLEIDGYQSLHQSVL